MKTKEIKEILLNWITKNYDIKNAKMAIKFVHIQTVADNAKDIATWLNLSKEDVDLAYVLGLLHDFGRFEQLKRQDNYKDFNGFDHGDYGAKILFDDNLIKMFPIEEKYYKLLRIGIVQHNKLHIDKSIIEPKILLYAKIIRDADKLDFLRVTIYDRGHFNQTSAGVTKEVVEFIKNKQQVVYNFVHTKLDKAISCLGLIFDFNFIYTKQKLIETNFFNKLYESYIDSFTKQELSIFRDCINIVIKELYPLQKVIV